MEQFLVLAGIHNMAIGNNWKGRTRNSKYLHRKQGKRQLYARILIVCEGEQTEVNYLQKPWFIKTRSRYCRCQMLSKTY